MKIRNIYFDNCFLSSGSLNFYGDGYWYDQWLKSSIPGFKEAISQTTFVAKTATLGPRLGNMPIDQNFQPRKLKPRCIKVYCFKGMVLNAVGLSNPGIEALLRAGMWQQLGKPFFISFMAVGDTSPKRMEEIKKFVDILGANLARFRTSIGLQINVSCPNTKHKTEDLAAESLDSLYLASELHIPLDLKVNALISNGLISEIGDSGLCDSLTISNTIPYGSPGIDWEKLFGQKTSPLEKYGGGGLSGKPILPIVLKKITDLRRLGITMPIKGSGGILSPGDVDLMKKAGASAVEIGSALILRPWRVPAIIERAKQIF